MFERSVHFQLPACHGVRAGAKLTVQRFSRGGTKVVLFLRWYPRSLLQLVRVTECDSGPLADLLLAQSAVKSLLRMTNGRTA